MADETYPMQFTFSGHAVMHGVGHHPSLCCDQSWIDWLRRCQSILCSLGWKDRAHKYNCLAWKRKTFDPYILSKQNKQTTKINANQFVSPKAKNGPLALVKIPHRLLGLLLRANDLYHRFCRLRWECKKSCNTNSALPPAIKRKKPEFSLSCWISRVNKRIFTPEGWRNKLVAHTVCKYIQRPVTTGIPMQCQWNSFPATIEYRV